MTTKKILSVIFGLIFIGAFAFVLTWGILNWQQVKDGMSGSGLYTQEDLNNAYDDGYNSALKDKNEYDELVKSYRDEITRLTDENSKANSNYNDLQKENKNLRANISSLESEKSGLQNQVDAYKASVQSLNDTIDENNKKISDFENQISQKEKEIENLKSIGANKDSEISNLNGQITSLRSQISSLQTFNSQLESTNQANLTIISNLNAQIASLNAQIITMQNQYQGNQDIINALNDKISQLEKSIEYYEQFIANLESGEKVVATFEFNGAVINIQILQKGSKVMFPSPESTDYVIFNYWETENGEKVQDTSSYIISENTKFVANVTLKFDVKFSVDGIVRESQIVENGQKPSLPTETPSKAGYDFDGWTLNGVDVVDPTQQSITQNTTFVAKFTQKFTVTFMYESETKSIQQVRSGEHAQNVVVESTTYKKFNGWKVNGEIVNVEDYEIVGETTYVADITYYYDVKFMVNGDQFGETQIVEFGKFASLPQTPIMDGYDFDGWTVDSVIVDVSSYAINKETTFVAKFVSLYFEEVSPLNVFSGHTIDYSAFGGLNVWSDGTDYYYDRDDISGPNDVHKHFNPETGDFEDYSSKISFGWDVWSIGDTFYFSHYTTQYVRVDGLWKTMHWNGLTSFSGRYVWSNGKDYFYSNRSEQYVLDVDTFTWSEKVWNGAVIYDGYNVWSDGKDFYFSAFSYQYIIDFETSTLSVMTWNGFDSISCTNIWNYGGKYYYSYGDKHYVLNVETHTWSAITWNISEFNGKNIFKLGDNIYCYYLESSNIQHFYILSRREI